MSCGEKDVRTPEECGAGGKRRGQSANRRLVLMWIWIYMYANVNVSDIVHHQSLPQTQPG